MRPHRVVKPPLSRRWKVLAIRVASKGAAAEMLCSSCTTFGSLYLSSSSSRCSECVHYSVRCDGNFSVDDFDHLTVK
jgi:hypothetical protein